MQHHYARGRYGLRLWQNRRGVYRLQGVKINDKHFEIIVRQMMRKVEIGKDDSGQDC